MTPPEDDAPSQGGLAQVSEDDDKTTPRWMRTLVKVTDELIPIPWLKGGVGLDAIIGFFVPVAGDAITGVGSIALLLAAARRGAPASLLWRMVGNIGIDVLSGALPVVGDIADVFWRSNRRNLELFKEYEGLKNPDEAGSKMTAKSYGIVAIGILAALVAVAIPLTIAVFLGTTLWRALFGS